MGDDDSDILRELWELTLSGDSLEDLNPDLTYDPRGSEDGSASFDAISLPSFTIAGGSLGERDGPERSSEESGIATTLGGGAQESGLETIEEPESTGPDPRESSAYVRAHESSAESAPTIVTQPGDGSAGGTIDLPIQPSPATGADAVLQYELREIIGRGGMGVVYRARQCSLGRDVAVKRLLTARDARGHQKFLAEALVTARLDHPNVVPVHDLGQTSHGDALIAMKLVDGISWKRILHPLSAAEHARHEAFDLEDHLRTLISVCNAVAFAHSRNIAHLDLKPENVMLGEFGEVLVMDWGLAVDVSDEPPTDGTPHATGIKAPCGTPAYMAPELARGNGALVGRQTDVYLLGAILHELITGKPPHRAKGTYRVILKAARSEPPEYAPEVPEELAAIAKRAMSREHAERHESVEAFRDEVEAFLQHRESLTITTRAQERLSACRAADTPTADRDALYAGFAAAAAGFAQALLLWAENDEARAGERAAHLAYASAALERGDLGLARAQLTDQSGPEAAALTARVDEAAAARARSLANEATFRRGLKAAIGVIVVVLAVGFVLVERQRRRAVSSEGVAREAAEAAEAARGDAEQARIKADQARVKAELQLAGSLIDASSVQGSAGDWAAARRGYHAAAKIFDRLGEPTFAAQLGLLIADGASPEPLLTLGSGAPVQQVAFSDDRRVVGADGAGRLRLWDGLTGRLLAERAAHESPVRGLAIGRLGQIVSLGAQGDVRIWRGDLSPAKAQLIGTEHVTAIGLDSSGAKLLTGDRKGQIQAWDMKTGLIVRTFDGGPKFPSHTRPIDAVAFASNETYAWSSAPDALLRWYAPRGTGYWGFRRDFPPGVRRIAVNRKRREVAFACEDHSVRVWPFVPRRPHNFTETSRLTKHTGPVRGLAYSPDAKHLVSGSTDGRVIVWRRGTDDTFTWARTLTDPGGGVESVAIAHDGRRVAVGSRDGALRLWDLGLDLVNPTGAERSRAVVQLQLPPSQPTPPQNRRARLTPWVFTEAAISPDGFLVAVGTQRGSFLLFEATTGLPVRVIRARNAPLTALAFPKDEWLFTGSADGTARLWNLDGVIPLHTLKVEPVDQRPVTYALHPTRGKPRVAVARGDRRLHVLDLLTESVTTTVDGESTVDVVGWSGDGQRILTASRDGSFALWAAGGRSLSAMKPGSFPAITALAVTANGERAVLGSVDGSLRLVETRSGKVVAELPRHVDRVTAIRLSPDELRVFSASVDGTWRVWSTARQKPIRSIADRGKIRAFALRRDARQALVIGDNAELWSFERPRERARWAERLAPALATLARAPRDHAARATLGRWYAFQGELRSALTLLDRPGPDSDADLARLLAHWQLGHLHAAQRALVDVARDPQAPPHYLRLIHDELVRRTDLEGTLLGREGDRVHAVGFTPGGARAITTCDSGEAKVWDPRTARLLRVYRGHFHGIFELAISADGKLAATGDRSGKVAVWEIATGRTVWSKDTAHGDNVKGLAFLPDGGLLSASSKPVLARWKPDGSPDRTYTGFQNRIGFFALAPNGQVAAVSHGRGLLRLVALETGEEIRSWQVNPNASTPVAFAPDGKSLFTIGQERKPDWQSGLHEWNAATGKRLRTLAQGDRVSGFTIGPTGRFGVTIARGGRVQVWDLTTGEEGPLWQTNQLLFTVALSQRGQALMSGRWGKLVLRELNENRR